jgi:hypothetical protein
MKQAKTLPDMDRLILTLYRWNSIYKQTNEPIKSDVIDAFINLMIVEGEFTIKDIDNIYYK